jgi:uncharacterized protein YkwD
MLRSIIILFVFFGALFYFRAPLANVAPGFAQLHSAYSDSFKQLFNEVTSATSSAILKQGQNYIPSLSNISSDISNISNVASDISNVSSNISNIANQIATSSPVVNTKVSPTADPSSAGQSVLGESQTNSDLLPVTSDQQEGDLSVQGIISDTNKERALQGLPNLNVSDKLNQSAEFKLQDMFKNQYFEHVSPSGQSVSDVVRQTGYDYIVVGENLALGVFGGDQQVVDAWMASPGHKRNILDPRYQDIGLAVGKGLYQGRTQWLIVQHFGKPLSACSSPSDSIKTSIDTQKADVANLETQITTTRAQIDSLTGDAYLAKANEYNALVIDYNTKLTNLKQTIDTYNQTVKQFNTCAGITSN